MKQAFQLLAVVGDESFPVWEHKHTRIITQKIRVAILGA